MIYIYFSDASKQKYFQSKEINFNIPHVKIFKEGPKSSLGLCGLLLMQTAAPNYYNTFS